MEMQLEHKDTMKERLETVAGELLQSLPMHVRFLAENYISSYLAVGTDIDEDTILTALGKVKDIIRYIEEGAA
jgi:hypothetical protein